MRSFRRAGLGLALIALWATSASPILASDNGTVDATVTVATPCISILTPTIDFGTLPFSAQDIDGTGQYSVSYENCGATTERIWAAGTDATGTSATWNLIDYLTTACDQPLNTYRIQVARDSISANLTETAQALELLASSTGSYVGTTLFMPCSGSDGVGQVMSFQILFTATF